MTPSQKLAYGWLALAVGLFALHCAAALAAACQFLPDDPLAALLPQHRIGGLAAALLSLAAFSGLLGGGVYAALRSRANDRLPDEGRLRLSFGLWTLAALAALLTEWGGALSPLRPAVASVQIIAAGLALLTVAHAAPVTPLAQVWLVGMATALLGRLLTLVVPSDPLAERALRALALGLVDSIGAPLAAVALAFWLMHRFSRAPLGWVQQTVYAAGGLVALAGAFASLPPLVLLGAPDWARAASSLGALVIPASYLVVAAHMYRAFSDRNATYTLAAHWCALGLLLLLIGPGLLGALQALPGVYVATAGTYLTRAQTSLARLVPLAISLGIANQAAAELRGRNWRVTGLIPFWLTSFGMVGGALALGAAGVAQTYLERLAGVGYLETQRLLTPLLALWVFSLALVGLGAAIYGLTFWRRRPVERFS